MELTKPSVLSGVMELLPEEQMRFEQMLNTIRKNFEKFAFYPLDTTVIEKAEVLLAKGGGNTEKQIYRFEKGSNDIALRFDLTVPLARYVAQHVSELPFPFRRYQIGKVYRGERKQRGRYREFYQCDVDIIGQNKLHVLNDAEIPAVMHEIFTEMELPPHVFHINNRKILNGYFRGIGIADTTEALRILDKIRKVPAEEIRKDLEEIGATADQIAAVMELSELKGSNEEILTRLESMDIEDPDWSVGVEELRTVYKGMIDCGVEDDSIAIDLSITRGLDYYTGTVYETFLVGHEEIGSICSGGRYDNLASHYTTQQLPGVGMSIGLTRLFSQLVAEDLLPKQDLPVAKAAVIAFPTFESEALKVANAIRETGKSVLPMLESGKIGKKMQLADRLGIRWAILIGEDEVATQQFTLRNMETGDQSKHPLAELANYLV